MYAYMTPVLAAAEQRASENDRKGMYAALRHLPFEQFNDFLISLPREEYPGISSIAPRMASAEVQNGWTGNNGRTLLSQTLSFVRAMLTAYAMNGAKPLKESKVLDFGCGYGRLIRPLYYYCDADQIYGCDPWDMSIKLCTEAGVDCHLAQSEYLPASLPFEEKKFDLIFAFSVFTHLSERATKTCLDTLSRSLADGGVVVVTIRPEEYWNSHESGQETAATKIEEHRERGFAFWPHNRAPIDGDVTYGDTSMSLDYLKRACPDLKVVGTEHSFTDPMQIIVFLQRAT